MPCFNTRRVTSTDEEPNAQGPSYLKINKYLYISINVNRYYLFEINVKIPVIDILIAVNEKQSPIN